MNERIRVIRKKIGINQAEFGARLGVTAAAISRIEVGERSLTEQMILAVCREFKINEQWLRTGTGEMFVVTEKTILRQLSEQYDLDALDQVIIGCYVSLPKAHREVIKNFVRKIANASSLPGIDTEIAAKLPATAQNVEDEWINS